MSKRKLVMEEHDGSVLVGVLQEGCDPIIKTKEGTLEQVLPAVPDFLTEAQEKWALSPKNPAYKAPTPAKATATPAAAPTPAQKAEDLPLLSGTEKPVPAEEKPAEAVAEVAKPPAAPAEIEPEPEPVPTPAPPEYAPMPESEAGKERLAQATGEWEYYLQDGRGPYETIQLAMDALDLDKNTRPQHNRWDRLSTALKEKIQRRPKS